MKERMIELSKFNELEKKYSKKCARYQGMEAQLKKYKKVEDEMLFSGDGKDGSNQKPVMFFKRIKNGTTPTTGIIYLTSKRIRKNHCDVCGKRRKTTAHHLVPQRLESINKELSQLRIRVCSECDEGIHPENPYEESYILRSQRKRIINLERMLKKKASDILEPFWDIIDIKLSQVRNDVKGAKAKMPPKNLHAFHKYCEGKLFELEYFKKKIKFLVNRALGTNIKGPIK